MKLAYRASPVWSDFTRQSAMAYDAKIPALSACRMPCDESGSQAEAASPTASQSRAHTGSRRTECAAQMIGEPHRAPLPMLRWIHRVVESKLSHRSAFCKANRRATSLSVMQATIRCSPASAVYHHPSAQASTTVLDSGASSSVKKRAQQAKRSHANRRDPIRRAKLARRPVASTTKQARHAVPPDSRRCQPSGRPVASISRRANSTSTPPCAA